MQKGNLIFKLQIVNQDTDEVLFKAESKDSKVIEMGMSHAQEIFDKFNRNEEVPF